MRLAPVATCNHMASSESLILIPHPASRIALDSGLGMIRDRGYGIGMRIRDEGFGISDEG
jgi:hypothetical protein